VPVYSIDTVRDIVSWLENFRFEPWSPSRSTEVSRSLRVRIFYRQACRFIAGRTGGTHPRFCHADETLAHDAGDSLRARGVLYVPSGRSIDGP